MDTHKPVLVILFLFFHSLFSLFLHWQFEALPYLAGIKRRPRNLIPACSAQDPVIAASVGGEDIAVAETVLRMPERKVCELIYNLGAGFSTRKSHLGSRN